MKSTNSNIIDISDEEHFEKEVLKSQEPVIVDFYANWCGPCKKLGPLLEEACKNQKTFKLAKVNTDDNQDLSNEYKVSGIPHVILFSQGKEVMQFTGLDQSKLQEMIEKCKSLSKPKAFSGTGTMLDSSAQFADEDLPEELFNDILNSLPAEPSESDMNSFNIIFKYNDMSLQRRFNPDDTIETLKLFVKSKVKSLREIELFEPFPRKVYVGNSQIKSSGISKNQILLVKLV
jgi:thioredoxin 1